MNYLKHFFSFVLLVLVTFCVANGSVASDSESKKIVSSFFTAVNNADFNAVSGLISDDFVMSEGDFIIANSKESFYTVFQWDSVFSPKTVILDIVENDNVCQVALSKECSRIKFLHDSEIEVKVRVTIEGGLITKMETYDYPKFDLNKWQERRGKLIAWISVNHSELNGFINDMTKAGGEKYLKAIELYKNQ